MDPEIVSGRSALERDPSLPYVISEEEFGESEVGWQQLTITYFAGDSVLVDDQDVPIPDVVNTVGLLPIALFGEGTSVYVRNPRLEIDFEMVLDTRAYTDAILNYGRPGG